MPDKPEVAAMADALGIDPDMVVGKLLRFWIWCDSQSRNCHALGVTEKFIDRLVRQNNFAENLKKVGWLNVKNGELVVPHFDRHNGQTSKDRALNQRRQEKIRSRKSNGASVTKPLPEEEEEEDIDLSHTGGTPPAEKAAEKTATNLPADPKQAVQFAGVQAIPEDFIVATFERCMAVGWIDTQRRPIASWPHYLAKSWRDEQQRAKQPAGAGKGAPRGGPVPWQRQSGSEIEDKKDF